MNETAPTWGVQPVSFSVDEGSATVTACGLRWQVTGWLGAPEVDVDVDEIVFSGPAAGDPGVWLRLRHTFDRTWQVRLAATTDGWVDWPGVQVEWSRSSAIVDPQSLVGAGDDEDPLPPVWSWALGAESWLLAADGFDRPVLFGSLRRGMTVAHGDGVRVPEQRLTPADHAVTTWVVDRLPDVSAAMQQLPAWLPTRTALPMGDELIMHAPDHGLVTDRAMTVIEEEGVTSLSVEGAGYWWLTLHGARGTNEVVVAWAEPLEAVVVHRARELVAQWESLLAEEADGEPDDGARDHPAGQRQSSWKLPAADAMVLSTGASAGVAGAAQLLLAMPIVVDDERERPLLVAACAMELARTGDLHWLNLMDAEIDRLDAVPGAPSAVLRALISSYAVEAGTDPYTVKLAQLVQDNPGTSPILDLELAVLAGAATDRQAELVAGLLGWGMPLGPLGSSWLMPELQAAAVLGLADEHIGASWPVRPSVIAQQVSRWARANAGDDNFSEMVAWLILTVPHE